MIKIQFRRKPAPPIEPRYAGPKVPGSYLFTLRSVPRHHDPIRDIIDSGGGRVYFSEPLAYLRGQAVSIFRVEAKDLKFFDVLYDWWRQTEQNEAFSFDINLFFNDREWVASLREHTPDEIRKMIQDGAPRTPSDRGGDDAIVEDARREVRGMVRPTN